MSKAIITFFEVYKEEITRLLEAIAKRIGE